MAYEPPTLQGTAVAIRRAFIEHDLHHAFRLVAWFCDDIRKADKAVVAEVVAAEPESTGDHRWDAMLAGVAEYVATGRRSRSPAGPVSRSASLTSPGS